MMNKIIRLAAITAAIAATVLAGGGSLAGF